MGEQETTEALEGVLRREYERVVPTDSWEDLRKRIDERLAIEKWRRQGVFWKRVALAMAACLVVSSGLLGLAWLQWRKGSTAASTQLLAASAPWLNDAQTQRLGAAFEQIRAVFADQAAWFMVDSNGGTQIGVSNGVAQAKETSPIVVIRLALQGETQAGEPRCLDVVAVLQRRVDLQIPLAEGVLVDVSLLPRLSGDGGIVLETRIQASGSAPAGGTVAVSDAPYASLARVRAGDKWVHVHAVAKFISI